MIKNRKIQGFGITEILGLLGSVGALIMPAVKYGINKELNDRQKQAAHYDVALYNGTENTAKFTIEGMDFVVSSGETGQVPDGMEEVWKGNRTLITPKVELTNSDDKVSCPSLQLNNGNIMYSIKEFSAGAGDKAMKKVVCMPTAYKG